jgi:SAM-dependent methyltransferase
MPADIWKDRDVARAFLTERSLLIPDRPRQLEVLHRVVSTFCPRPRRILDLGAGDALLLATLLEAFPQASGLAVDFSPPMLEQARTRLIGYGTRASAVEADLQAPAWKDGLAGPWDVVVSGFAIHHLPDPRKRALYQEIHAVLAPGGVFVNSEHVASPSPRIEGMFDEVMTQHLFLRRQEKGEAVTLEQVRRDFMERPDRAANILAPVDEQCCWLRDIGFREVDCFWKYFELAVFGGVK